MIIAEKQKVAAKAAFWLEDGAASHKNNFYITANYYIAYADGQLFEPYDIEDYTKEEPGWKMDNLPFCPPGNNFFYRLTSEKDKEGKRVTKAKAKALFNTINYLVNLPEVTRIIHFGDADREGEVIIRQILRNSNKSDKPVYRLWTGQMTKAAFQDGLRNMILDVNYDNLADEGFVRQKTDWLYGINLTRYLSLKCKANVGHPLRAGRVLCGMLNEIYEREMEIRQFVPEHYYALISDEETNGQKIRLRLDETFHIDDYIDATSRCVALNNAGAVVSDIHSEEKTRPPGKLYSLTTLQNALSKRYGMSMSESIVHIQSVYEKGFITYPRTNTEYLGDTEKASVQKLIEIFTPQGFDLLFRESKTIFDDSKIEGHSALLPTYKLPQAGELSAKEMLIYTTVRNRFLAVFCAEKSTYKKTVMTITCGDAIFNLTGSIMLTKGFLKYEEIEKKDILLPDLQIGDTVNISFSPVEEATTPPPRYTEVTFNNFLEHPFKNEDSTEDEIYEDLKKGLSIGTVATRTSIIENMITCGYIIRDKQIYKILPLGIYFVETLRTLGIDITKEKTAENNMMLKKVNTGDLSSNEALEIVKSDLDDMFKFRDKDIDDLVGAGILNTNGRAEGSELGTCPICDGNIYETKAGFSCENNKKQDGTCFFFLWKKDKYLNALSGKELTSSNVSSALSKGYFNVKIKAKDNKTYESILKLRIIDNNKCGWELERNAGKCPVCKGNVMITPFGWKCENNGSENNTCFFVLFQNDRFIESVLNRPLSLSNVMKLLKNGSFTARIEKKDKSGKYSIKLSLVIDKIAKKISWHREFVHGKS